MYSIFFGKKAAKQKLPILKERWFDIPTIYHSLTISEKIFFSFM